MALQPCRECGAQVSTEAETCPHCGVPEPTQGSQAGPTPHDFKCESCGERVDRYPCKHCGRHSADSHGKPTSTGVVLGWAVLAIVVFAGIVNAFAGLSGGSEERDSTASTPPSQDRPDSLYAVVVRQLDRNPTRALLVAERLAENHPTTVWADSAALLIPPLRDSVDVRAERAAEEAREARLRDVWTYSQFSDEMSEGQIYQASIRSDNTVAFDAPYDGPQRASLTLRTHPRYGTDVIFRIERGQLLCNSYDGCDVRVRFDDREATSWRAAGPSDNSTEVLFIRDYERFVSSLRGADVVRVQPEVYQEGAPVLRFEVGGYDHGRYQGEGVERPDPPL